MKMHQRGQSTVELVLLMPLLLVLLFLVFEVGRLFGSWLLITNAAREGARYAAVLCVPSGVAPGQTCAAQVDPTAAVAQRVQQTAQFLVLQTATACTVAASGAITIPANNNSCVSVTYSLATDGTNEGIVTVSVAYNVQTLMPITGNIPFLGAINYPGAQQVNGTSSMRLEQ